MSKMKEIKKYLECKCCGKHLSGTDAVFSILNYFGEFDYYCSIEHLTGRENPQKASEILNRLNKE